MATAVRLQSSKTGTEVPIGLIRVGSRTRKDLGDLDSLAESIAQVGLLHALVVSPDNRLIAGFRRLKACNKLGWKMVPVRVIDLDRIVEGEFAENACRKDFTPEEAVRMGESLEKLIKPEVEKRHTEKSSEGGRKGGRGNKKGTPKKSTPLSGNRNSNLTSAKAASDVGMSRTLRRARSLARGTRGRLGRAGPRRLGSASGAHDQQAEG